MNPDDLRDAYHRVWMRQYLNREPASFWEEERKRVVPRLIEIQQLESWWELPEREEP